MLKKELSVDLVAIIRAQHDPQYGQRQYEAFNECQSEAERCLLHGLLKAYPLEKIEQQFEVGGYRLDFRTDRVAWEIDGKQFHEPERDRKRDLWILEQKAVDSIIRIQAGAYHWFRNACLRLFATWLDDWPYIQRNRPDVHTAAEAAGEADELLDYWHEIEERVYFFVQGEAFQCDDTYGVVGSPFAFLPEGHAVSEHVPKHERAKHRWLGWCEYRRLDNVGRWFEQKHA